ncbi:MAG: 30S ribosomal protein S4, partial [Cyanobacteriota bacterium]
MARHTKSVCKLCRNEGKKLFLKGNRCNSAKCGYEKRPYHSGVHGQNRKKLSEYAVQLREKNKLRNSYLITEKQFARYFKMAEAQQQGVTGTILLQLLEARFDNVVFRSGLVHSKPQARQLIRHRHLMVNGRIVDIPSYRIKPGDKVSVKEKSANLVKVLIEEAPIQAPHWITVDKDKLIFTFDALPTREDLDPNIKEQLIIEYYSR